MGNVNHIGMSIPPKKRFSKYDADLRLIKEQPGEFFELLTTTKRPSTMWLRRRFPLFEFVERQVDDADRPGQMKRVLYCRYVGRLRRKRKKEQGGK